MSSPSQQHHIPLVSQFRFLCYQSGCYYNFADGDQLRAHIEEVHLPSVTRSRLERENARNGMETYRTTS